MNANTTAVPPVRIVYTENAEFLLESSEHASDRKMAKMTRLFIWAIVFFVPVRLSINLVRDVHAMDVRDICINLVFIFGVPVFFWVFGILPTKKSYLRRSKKAYRNLTGRNETTMAYEFGDGGFSCSTHAGTTMQHPWSTISKVVEKPDGLLIYTGPKIFLWFPKRFFTSATEYEQLLQIVERKFPNFKRINSDQEPNQSFVELDSSLPEIGAQGVQSRQTKAWPLRHGRCVGAEIAQP